MRKLLILLVAGLFGTASLLHAQVPIGVQKVTNHSGQYRKNVNAETPCPNQAGTFDVGAFTGQSNDTDFPTLADTIFLCYNDQLLLDHNGNFNLLGDPDMSTAPGVVWAFHQCAPTVSGPTLDDITAATNTCLWPNGPAPGNIWVARDQIGGDILLNNQGQLQNNAQFNPGANQGKPVTVILAPVTIDNFNGIPQPTYEPIAPGFPPGPCVNLNINDWVRVAYLNPIQATGLSSNAGNDCIGRFRVEGGYPELVAGARYTIDISLASNPSVKGVLHLPSTSLTYFANVSFSVPQSGTYNISISDGKSCSYTGQINMTTCNPSDNVVFTSPDIVSPPNSSVCIPVLSQNLDILAAGFSINWDPAILDYDSITGINPILTAVNPSNAQDKNDFVVSDLQSANGALAFSIINTLGNPISVPDNDTLFYICYTVIAPLGECTPLEVTSDPAQISFENAGGALALTDNLGTFCVNNLALSFTTAVIDSTCQTGMGILVVDPIGGILPHEVVVRRIDGMGTTPNGTLTTTDATFTTNVGVQNTPVDYEICVTDDNGQGTQYCDTITVFIPIFGAQLIFTQEPTCFGDSDGIITVNILENGTLVTNPGSNYSYAWSLNGTPIPTATGRVLVGAASGNYQVVVTDNLRSCNFSASGLLGQPQQVRRQTLTATPATCLGVNDGIINMQAQGGTPGYTYDWTYAPDQTSATSPAGTGAMISNLLAGFYRVTVSDSRGCTGIDSVSVTNQKTVDVAGNSTNTLCFGDNTGTVIVNVSESPSTPGATYNFVWTPGGFTETSTGNSSTYADLPAGNYHVLAIDAAGCQDTASFVVTSPTELSLDTTSLINPSCAFPASGTIIVAAFGGTSSGPNSYNYTWSPTATGATQNNLLPGDYSVTVSDLNGCVDSLHFRLDFPAPPAISSIDSVSVRCGGDGSLTVNAPTGEIFLWTDINGTLIEPNNAQISGLDGGTYVVNVSDGLGCVNSDTITLAGVLPIVITDTFYTQPTCFGLTDGSIGISVTGGSPTYNYNWSPNPSGQNGATLSPIGAGNYIVTITDSEGCTLVDTFALTQPPSIAAELNNIKAATCSDACDGGVTIVSYYNTVPPTPGTFSFLWDDNSTASTRVDLCPGLHMITISDANNCSRVDQLTIAAPPAVTANITVKDVSCNGDDDGAMTATGGGGNGGAYKYLWSTGSTSATISNLAVGDSPNGLFSLTVTDKEGCTMVFSETLEEPDPLVIELDTLASQEINCFGGEDGVIAVTVTGGNTGGNLTYQWEDDLGNSVGSGATITDLSAGVYYVTVTDAQSCTTVDSILLFDPPAVRGIQGNYLPLDCFGDETLFTVDTIFGGSGAPYYFSVDGGVRLTPGETIPVGGGEHLISYFDGKGCEITDSLDIIEPAEITVDFDPAVIEIELGATEILSPIVNGLPGNPAQIIWTPSELLVDPSLLEPTTKTFENTLYTLVLVDSAGCSGTGSIQINVDANRNIYIPNVFYSGDGAGGKNDHFNVYAGLGVEIVNFLRVYDRWGSLMYDQSKFLPSDQPADGWDGRYKGQFVNPGVYVYVAEVKFVDGRTIVYRGDVTVYR